MEASAPVQTPETAGLYAPLKPSSDWSGAFGHDRAGRREKPLIRFVVRVLIPYSLLISSADGCS